MTSISMLEFRQRADSILRAVQGGQPFLLTYRGKVVARLEPVNEDAISADDPIYSLAELATDELEPLDNSSIDKIVYGQ